MDKLGVMVEHLGVSQCNYYLSLELNKLHTHNIDCTVFHNSWEMMPFSYLFGRHQLIEAWSYDGPLIATNFMLAKLLLTMPGPSKKYFYIWDLEWYTKYPDRYEPLEYVYTHKNIELIARTEHHAKIIENCWKTPSHIIENFDSNKLVQL